MALEILFIKILETAKYLNKKYGEDFDGLEFWRGMKPLLAVMDKYEASNWKALNKIMVKNIMLVSEYTINGYGDDPIIIASHHFLIQQVRIPTNDKPTIRKILQVALNIGQWKGRPDPALMKKIKYSTLGLDKLSKYITDKDIKKLSAKISPVIMDSVLLYLLSKR